MQVDEYLFRNKITKKSFAKRLGISQSMMCALAQRKHTPTLMLAIKIIKESQAAVHLVDLLKDADREKLIKCNIDLDEVQNNLLDRKDNLI